MYSDYLEHKREEERERENLLWYESWEQDDDVDAHSRSNRFFITKKV